MRCEKLLLKVRRSKRKLGFLYLISIITIGALLARIGHVMFLLFYFIFRSRDQPAYGETRYVLP